MSARVIGPAALHLGDCRAVLASLPAESVQCVVTSPPYWGLRDYGADGQLGLESTPDEYVAAMVEVFRVVWRVLREDGTLWLNLGDSYASGGRGSMGEKGGLDGSRHNQTESRRAVEKMGRSVPAGYKPKDIVGIPWRVAFALRADGWYLRSDIIWHKPNPMPESVTDRPTKAHEYLFLLTKSERYFYDTDAVREESSPSSIARARYNGGTPSPKSVAGAEAGVFCGPMSTAKAYGQGRNKRSVWTVPTQPFRGAHFATFPPALVEPCILAGSAPGDTVLDPFNGAGTTGVVALQHGRRYIGIELNPEYLNMAAERLRPYAETQSLFDPAA